MLIYVVKVIVSSHNSLGDGRYFDVESSSSFAFDHSTQVFLESAYAAFWKLMQQVESEWSPQLRFGEQSIRSRVSGNLIPMVG